jgi:predicted TIM-barrel fold metal-dependent hydrolase
MQFFGGGWRYADDGLPEGQSLIIDAHFHIFRRFGVGVGSEDAKLLMRLWQYHFRDFTEIWRRRDGARMNQPLLDFDSDDIDAMSEVNFRMGRNGQAEFTIEGEDYYVQLFPPNVENLEATPDRMIAEMDVAGVNMGVLQSDHAYGANINELYGEAQRRYPGRLIGLAQIREIEADQPAQLERLERAVREHGCRGLYFSVELFALNHYTDHIDDARFEPLWNKVRELQLPVWWYLDARQRDRTAGFMQRLAELDRWAQAHPDIPAVITHGIVPATIIHSLGLPPAVWTLLKRPNMYAEVLMQAKWPEYPFPGGQDMLKQLRDEVGAEKLMWGSDMPFSGGTWCTYRQAVDFIRRHCNFLSPAEKALILGGNAARMFNISLEAKL